MDYGIAFRLKKLLSFEVLFFFCTSFQRSYANIIPSLFDFPEKILNSIIQLPTV